MAIFVNGFEIKDAEIGREMQYHPAQDREHAWHLAAQSLVIRQLLLQRAADAGLCDAPGLVAPCKGEEEAIDRLLQMDVSVPEADEATCRWFYDRHPDSFIDAKAGEKVSFSRAKAPIRDYLHAKAMRVAVAEYIRALSERAAIKGFDLRTDA